MTTLPITRMTLYKHGVGFFERRAEFTGDEVTLSFRVEEMNDILKSLTAIDWGDGKVLGVDYATPQSQEERLAGCSIRLGDTRSLRDLLRGLRGRRVTLLLDGDETAVGKLLGLDEPDKTLPIAKALVSILLDETAQVQTVPLKRVLGAEILDERGADDLRFFLQTSLSQENYRQVTVRLTPGEHELSVSYIAPAPTWRVSYRLVADSDGEKALLLGWGIFDNRLEEELKDISLSLVAGMPISFIYDLYTPFTPERPEIKEESRVAAGPVGFGAAMKEAAFADAEPMMRSMAMAAPAAPSPQRSRRIDKKSLEETTAVAASGESMGELFQYNITTPVSVGRGQSAMVPIVSTNLGYRKDLLYNGRKLPNHPVASLRLENKTGLTLERGPVTVIESGEYVGEAILPFTVEEAEFIIPYAVELGVKISERSHSQRETHSISLKDGYLLVEEWDVQLVDYQLNNSTNKPIMVLIEQARNKLYDLFETAEPEEMTDEHYRFQIEAKAKGETQFKTKTRRLFSRRQEIKDQNFVGLQRYLNRGLIDRVTHDRIAELLNLWQKVADYEKRLAEIEKERQQIYKAQQQIQGNMKSLSMSGKEGALRSQYVDRLEATEQSLEKLAQEESQTKIKIQVVEKEILAKLGK